MSTETQSSTEGRTLAAPPPVVASGGPDLERHVHVPHRVGLPPLGAYLRDVWERREFAFEMSRNELRSRHFDTAFGQLWLILNPLLLAGVYFVLVDIIRHGHRPHAYLAHLVGGIFAYYFVSDSVRMGSKSVVQSGKLILNTAFPRTLLPISTVMTAFIRFLPTIAIYMVVHVVSGLPIGPVLLWSIPIFATLVVIALGLAMIVAAAQVYFRDLGNFLPYLLRLWLYVSPVLYFADNVPDRYKVLIAANPIGAPLTAWSDTLYSGVAPGWHSLLIGAVWAIVLLVGGALFFVSREREFAVRL